MDPQTSYNLQMVTLFATIFALSFGVGTTMLRSDRARQVEEEVLRNHIRSRISRR